jgi:esterase/lipase superfamily enzyme
LALKTSRSRRDTADGPGGKRWFKRPVLLSLIAVGCVLFASALYAYFWTTKVYLQHAEAFSFRRMIVAQVENQGLHRFYFTTNRRRGGADADLGQRYGSERGDTVEFGSFDTEIKATLGLGMIIDPSDWLLNEEIRLKTVRDLDRKDMVAQLRDRVAASSHRSLLVIVHGFRERFPSALRKTAFLAHVLDIDTPVLLFDWPGNQGSSLSGYRRARRVAKESGSDLADMLKMIVNDVQPERLWLVANSMGGEVVVNAFSILHREAAFSDKSPEFENVVLTAPDVDHRQFNSRFRQEISDLANTVTVYVSSNDRALLISRVINRGQRLGEATLDPRNPGQIEETANLYKLLEKGNDNLVLVDVTPVNRTRNFHNFSLETPEFFDDLFLRLTAPRMPQTREIYHLLTPDGARYSVLTRGR